jgi:hypothetical protein
LLARAEAVEGLLPFVRYTFPGFEAGEHHQLICEALEAV